MLGEHERITNSTCFAIVICINLFVTLMYVIDKDDISLATHKYYRA